ELVLRAADEDALPGREAVGFDDARRTRNRQTGRGWDFGRFEHLFGKALRPLDSGGRSARPEDRDAVAAQEVGEPRDERQLRSDDGEVDPELAAKPEQALSVLGPDRMAFAEPRDSRISRRGVERLEARALFELPGQRVLAAPR